MVLHRNCHRLHYSFHEAYFTPADEIFRNLEREIVYLPRMTIFVYGKEYPLPRSVAAYGEPGVCYTFSGRTHVAIPWTDTLKRLKIEAEALTECSFNFALVNRYANGLDSIGPHKDKEKDLDASFPIVSFSFGSQRKLVFKRKGHKKHSIDLKHGSVLIMKPPTNQFWTHEIPKQKTVTGPRINVTFRKIL